MHERCPSDSDVKLVRRPKDAGPKRKHRVRVIEETKTEVLSEVESELDSRPTQLFFFDITAIFDHTAITENTYGISWELAQHLNSEAMNMIGRRKNYVKHVLVDAKVVLNEKNILTVTDILLDTGATHASYTETWWTSIVRFGNIGTEQRTRFGDNKTSQKINEIVMLPLRMQYRTLPTLPRR
jgi:hypothetical protein